MSRLNPRRVGIAPAEDGDLDPQMIEVNSSHGKVNFERGDFDGALESFLKAYKVATTIPSIPDASLAQLLNNLALCSQKLGRWADATTYCARCLEHRSNYQRPDHVEFIRCQNYLANCFYHRKKYADAKKVYDQVLLTNTSKFGETHADTMRALHNTGLMAYYCGKKAEAQKVLESCWNLRSQILGANHPDTTSSKEALDNITESGMCTIS